MAATTQTVSLTDLTDLVSSNSSTTVYPSEDTLVSVLNGRFRSDLPYVRLGATSLVVVNPLKTLANVNDASARDYEERSFKDTSGMDQLQPHLYDLAARIYLMMKRRHESQSVVFRGITGSGKSFSGRLLVSQILRLSTHSKKEAKIAEQIKALTPLLESFGHAKTFHNSSASRHGRYLELHFSERGRIASAKVLTYGLDKSRLCRLSQEERSYHVFYQFLAGATPQERDTFGLEDPSDYALLASSGCYRLPGGPFSDDSIAMEELRDAFKVLGFKAKHTSAIYSLLVAILVLGNIQFLDTNAREESATIANLDVLDQAARLLGVPSDDLAQALTNKTHYVRKEVYQVFLNAAQSAVQRDTLVQDLYAILFSYIVETANHKIAPSQRDPPPATQIILLDQPGFNSRSPSSGSISLSSPAPLISAQGQNGFTEFCINFQNELVHSYVLRSVFEDSVGYNNYLTSDGIQLPAITTMDNSACIELLRGTQLNDRAQRKPAGVLGVLGKASSAYKQGKAGDNKEAELLRELSGKFGVHSSFVSHSSPNDRTLFGINHYSGSCSYDVNSLIERDTDVLDSAFVTILRSSREAFIAKLVSGPGMAAEMHHKDQNTIVQAQVSSRPLRRPTPVVAPDGSVPPFDDASQLDADKTYPVTTQINWSMSELFASLDQTRLWTVSCIRPNDSGSPNSFDKRRVKSQVRSLLLPDFIARRKTEYVADYDLDAFGDRYVPTMQGDAHDRIRQCAQSHGWREGVDYTIGNQSIWLTYDAWKSAEDVLRANEKELRKAARGGVDDDESGVGHDFDDATTDIHQDTGAPGGWQGRPPYGESQDNLVLHRTGTNGTGYNDPNTMGGYAQGGMSTPHLPTPYSETGHSGWGSEWDKAPVRSPVGGGDKLPGSKEGGGMVVNDSAGVEEMVPTSRARRYWVMFVWAMTWWIPDFLLSSIGRMKRPDIRMAWREKLTICLLIFLLCGSIIFYIIVFGKLICPRFNKAWKATELLQHTGENDFWVAIRGNVYDITKYWKGDHTDNNAMPMTQDVTIEFAGKDISPYFPPPLVLACAGLVTDPQVFITYKNTTLDYPLAVHTSGAQQTITPTALNDPNWYTNRFLPKIKTFYKGTLVWEWKTIKDAQGGERNWAVWNNKLYDLTDYLNSLEINQGASDLYGYIDNNVAALFKQQPGQDISSQMNTVMEQLSPEKREANTLCLQNMFYLGETDFRMTPRCQVQNWLLIAFSVLIGATILAKFLAALQLGGKRSPETMDKFVICQVPCYTEGEESLRRTIDSLAALNYDDKRKLMFLICDGNIIGSGNDRTTPRIALDILGVDPKLDPEPLLFRSIGEGSKQLNYGKVYSGLYEYQGHVVPYMVVVKVGKPSERSRPGNRGKRDSQILLMHYLNRVHFDAPMSPLELEIYHQMRNVIGIEPAFYEYILMVDADTTVTPDSLNRLVACTSDDSSIIAICGETKLDNEEGSWWTMIQVYEYYISHHLAKAFESLFGSVTCLPGCFSMYRIRTADKGRPLIISNRVIDDYSENIVDTLHKKNLLSLGEDRYLTTIMMKHFPTFKMKFTPDAIAHTVAPDRWSVLLSQRRRWINSTIHNLLELVFLPELCGFCCFSMRFVVFIDLLGTLILPATAVYIVWLIVTVSIGNAPIPTVSLVMLGAVYGLQAIIFLLKREFMLIGWMVIYLIAYPVYSFFLPIYSFWCMDDFSWGNTRVVMGEGSNKRVVVTEDEKFDESMIPLKKFSEYEAEAWETGSHHSGETKQTGFDSRAPSRSMHRPPASDSPRSYNQASQSGDFYRDTNLTYNNSSNPNLRLGPGPASQAHSVYGPPQLGPMPFMPFGGGPGSVTGHSDYGAPMGPPMGYAGSVYGGGGMMPMGPRNSVMTNLNMFGPGPGSAYGGAGGGFGGGTATRPISTFSLATTANPFAGPSQSTDPSDEELVAVLRHYLSTQDLMTVTKKTAREAVMARFPQADLASRKDFLNESIDRILSES